MKNSLIISILILLLAGSRSYSQVNSARPGGNIIEIFHSRSNPLNGIALGENTPYRPNSILRSLGLGYFRFLGKRNYGLEFSGYYRNGNYVGPIPGHESEGRYLVENNESYFSCNFHFPVIGKSRMSLFASSGLVFRNGYESLAWVDSPFFCVLFQGSAYKDVGLSMGSRLIWFPFRHIALSGDLRYTRFFYGHSTESSYHDFYIGKSKNLLAIQLKLGVCF